MNFPDTIVMHPDTRTSAQTCCEHYGIDCSQGDRCPQRMAAEARRNPLKNANQRWVAEACTEVGADEPWHPPATRLGLLVIVLAFVGTVAGIAAIWP